MPVRQVAVERVLPVAVLVVIVEMEVQWVAVHHLVRPA
jgi:hypothetical protein